MQRLLQFLYRYRTFILFIFLEGICFWVIVDNNNYQGSKYFNSANRLGASLVHSTDHVGRYFSLGQVNEALVEENARLRAQILRGLRLDTLNIDQNDSSLFAIASKVVDNSVFFRNNYLLINRGKADGVTVGQGVIGPDGIVGQVQRVSDHYSTVISLLHSRTLVSAKHGPSGYLCSVVWNGETPENADVNFLPRHLKINAGDTVVTSGYNSVYPEGIMIGVVKSVEIGPEATFYQVTIDLSTSFSNLSYVYLLEMESREELDSLRELNQNRDG